MHLRPTAILVALVFASLASAQETDEVTGLLKKLQSTDIDTRQLAMQDLQTSLDPRIPDACLPVLTLDGNSIRRLAARAIGSRWYQIPKDRVPVFTAALKAQLDNEHDGLVNMARRGIALLNRDYGDPMVSQSPNKRWVIYERYGLPCLIDTQSMTEELMGFPNDSKMICAYGNSELAPTVTWHPRKEMAAMSMIEGRKLTTVWVWVHGKGLRQLTLDEMLKALGVDDFSGPSGFFTDNIKWNGANLEFSVEFTIEKGDEYVGHEATLRWSPGTDKLSVLSDKVEE